jgi:hypothetical protein
MVSFKVLDRPTKKKRAAQMAKKATPPITIPTIAPVDREGLLLLPPPPYGGGVPVAVGALERVDDASAGTASPGATWKSAAAAAWTCDASVCVEFGLMTPTMSSPLQEFGAAQ